MSYQVLARKWRPHNFTEVVGQQHVVETLLNSLKNDRLHHAYLFTGTRGVGKTTIARILAKAINCEKLIDYNPCGACAVCKALDAGSFLDLIEVDAASRTKVDDTRDLLDNAQYAPNQGKYKVYLIDEIHMLSGHSFNALLKTLEEPPPHVKFLLATTDPQKIPVTVLSRCLQFNLRRLLPKQIKAQFELILKQENIAYEEAALQYLARAADGSMRDGLSLLDQAIVFGNGNIVSERVIDMLGTVARQPVAELLTALANTDAEKILATVAEMAELTPNFADILQQIIYFLHKITILQVAPNALDFDEESELLINLSKLLTKEDVQLYYQIALKGQPDLDLAPDPQSGFEMVLLRMLAFKPEQHHRQTGAAGQRPVAMETGPNRTNETAIKQAKATQARRSSNKEIAKNSDWTGMISAMKLGGMTLQLANNCMLDTLDNKQCILLLDKANQQLRSSKTEENLQKAIQNHQGQPVKLIIHTQILEAETPAVQLNKAREEKQQAAINTIETDDNIQALKNSFDAQVIPGSIEPV